MYWYALLDNNTNLYMNPGDEISPASPSKPLFFKASLPFMPPQRHHQLQRRYERLHLGSTAFLHNHRYVYIFIHRECDCGVTKMIGNRLHVHTVLRSEGGVGVPQIMKPNFREPHLRDKGFEVLVDRRATQVFAEAVGKNKVNTNPHLKH